MWPYAFTRTFDRLAVRIPMGPGYRTRSHLANNRARDRQAARRPGWYQDLVGHRCGQAEIDRARAW